jgi:hypothetical protein
MIIRNYAINLILFAQLAGLPRCGGSMTYDQIISNASVYYILSCFLILLVQLRIYIMHKE